MFDLEKAIAHWRKGLSQRRAFSLEDLDELEAHVRDHISAQQDVGVSDKDAFAKAVGRVGNPNAVASEYRKVIWTKARMRGGMLRMLASETAMIANYTKVAFRNLRRQRVYSAINIIGLAIGIACFMLIAMYVRHELSFDRHHEHADRIHRVSREWRDENGIPVLALAKISMPIGPAMERELPEVERSVRLFHVEAPVAVGDSRFIEEQVFVSDPGFFDIFSTTMVRGDPARALVQPHTIVLSDRMAEKYYGETDPLGQSLKLFDEFDLTVTGVISEQPATSHFHPDFLISFRTTESWTDTSEREEWGQYNNFGTYILLSESADPGVLQTKLPTFLRSHYETDNRAEDALILQPLTSIHLHSHLDGEFEQNGNWDFVMLFGAVAVFILLIACFNFVNLSTARSAHRSKEVGMRKALGADRFQLVKQFLGESTILTLIALVVGLGLVWIVLPSFTSLTGQTYLLSGLGWMDILIGIGIIVLLVSAFAGAYPAAYLSRFRTAQVFRQTSGGSSRSKLRSTLVVSQFATAIVLMVGMGVVVRQISFVQTKDLGFSKSNLLVLPIAQEMRTDFEPFRRQLVASPAVERVTASKLVPSLALVDHVGVLAEVNGEMRSASISLNPVDHDFVDTYGMKLAAGRSFSKDLASDSTEAFVINESAMTLLGWDSPEDAIDKPFRLETRSLSRPGKVVGVVEDFHFESLRNEIAPLVLLIMPERFNRVTVRVVPGRVDEALAFLEERWATFRPDYPFTYSFVDEDFGALYASEKKVGTLFGYFALLAVLIASLGLMGLASFVMERRRKEIGVRRVLGATVSGIVRLLSLDFLRLVGLSFIVACPLAYVIVQRWLERFAYRTTLDAWIFLLAGGTVAVIALITVCFQSIRTAIADPVISLKN